jgi:hypothetical protein
MMIGKSVISRSWRRLSQVGVAKGRDGYSSLRQMLSTSPSLNITSPPGSRGTPPSLIGLRLGDPATRLDADEERDRDRRQNTDHGHDDHQLDEREAPLGTSNPPDHRHPPQWSLPGP